MSLENTRDIGTVKIVMVGAGGDSNVVPNPSGTATDTLEKVGINGTIYGIEGVDALSDLTDTSISNPSTGQTIEYNSTSGKWENKLSTAVVANPSSSGSADLTKLKVGGTTYNIPSGGGSDVTGNPSSTATSYLAKIKIGNTTYDTSGIIPLFATGITSNYISISATNFAQLENRAVAIYTGSVSGTTQTHWILDINNSEVAIVDESGVAYSADIDAGTIILATIASVGSVMTATVVGVVGYPDPLAIEHGGTGNKVGYIQTGKKSNTTLGNCATAEGYDNTASGNFSHAEGRATTAGNYSHAEGYGTNAGAGANHAEGENTTASGYNCHAEGYQTTASGTYSHAGGRGTVAGYSTQTAIGKWNDNKSDTLFEVGNGTGSSAKSNAFEVYSDGKTSWDNGSSKFQFTQSSGVDGYKDAGGIFHAFGGDSYALVGMGQVTSYSNKVANTNVYLHRAPKEGDRLFIKFSPTITDSDAQIKIYDQYSGTAYTLSFNSWASGSKLAGLCLLEVQDNGLGTLGLILRYSFEGGTNYTAGAGIEINGSAISNTAPNYGVDVDGATISSVSSGNLGTYVGESKYLILYFSASASPYSGGYTLTLSYSGSVSVQEYGTLYDGSSRYNSNISAGTMLLCEITDTGAGSEADPVHVNIIGKIDPNSGGGNTVSKTRYQISSSSWSSSPNADGYYTLTTTINPAIGSSPDVYVAGSADGTQPTDTEKGQFAYVKRCKVNGSTLTLYASSKPSSTFYIWVEGVNGTGSGDIVGNVIQPNGESSGGGLSVYSEDINYTDFSLSSGEYKVDKNLYSSYSNLLNNYKRMSATLYFVRSDYTFNMADSIFVYPDLGSAGHISFAKQDGLTTFSISTGSNTFLATVALTQARFEFLRSSFPSAKWVLKLSFES